MTKELPEIKIDKNSLEDESDGRSLDTFAHLYEVADPIQRDYELIEAARRYDVPIDMYRRLFEAYCQAKSESELKRRSPRPKRIFNWFGQAIDLLTKVSIISIMVGAIAYVAEIPQRAENNATDKKIALYGAWQIVNHNQGKMPNGGRIDALQNLNQEGTSLAGLDVQKAILVGIDLKGAELTQANLSGANLMNGNLSGAVLKISNLSGALLSHTDLSGANLIGANLSKANLEGANLSDANLEGVNLNGANLRGVNLSGANLSYANLRAANVMGAELKTAAFKDTHWEKSIYDWKTEFPPEFDARSQKAFFISPGADLRGRDLRGFDLRRVDLAGANLTNADMSGVDLSRSNLTDANLTNANLKDARLLSTVGLTSAQVKRAKNWQLAKFSKAFRQKLDLTATTGRRTRRR